MRIGAAIEALENGKRVQRAGWNGKDMWLVHIDGPDDRNGVDYIVRDDRDESQIHELKLLPWIGMKTADGGFVPWLASQSDMLAKDWQIVGEAAASVPAYDAEIREAIEHDGQMIGRIYGDTKGRFRDGDAVTTSRVIERPPANGIYKTKNSTYLVTLLK